MGIHTVLHGANGTPHSRLRIVADRIRQGLKRVQLIFLHKLQQHPFTHLVAGDVGKQVSKHLIRRPDVIRDKFDYKLISHAAIKQLNDGDA